MITAPARRPLVVLLAFALTLATFHTAALADNQQPTASSGPDIRISEWANGGPTNGGVDNFIEIAQFGDEPGSIDGWELYRCQARGHRASSPQVPAFADVTLEPGETYTVAHADGDVAAIADEVYESGGLSNDGSGAWLQDADATVIDAIAAYDWSTATECAATKPPPEERQLTNSLNHRRAESYQRVGVTGDIRTDFIKAERTPGAPNATAPDPGVQPSDVLVSEFANGGIAGGRDFLIEIGNFGDNTVDISGWDLTRCITSGAAQVEPIVTFPDGTALDPGQVFVIAGEPTDVPPEVEYLRYDGTFSSAGSGVIVTDADGTIRDRIAVYEHDGYQERATDSACMEGTPLPNRLDFGFNDSYHRAQNTGNNADDFVKAPRSIGVLEDHDPNDATEPPAFEFNDVRISEMVHSGPDGHIDNFFELANYGDEPASLDGWSVYHCGADGRRSPDAVLASIDGAVLHPGDTFTAVREGSSLHDAGEFDATYTTDLGGESSGGGILDVGFGLMVVDNDEMIFGEEDVVDKAYVNTHASVPTTYSPCTNDVSLVNTVDAEAGYSFQRYQATGSETRDFVEAPRTPGVVESDLRHPADLTDEELAPVDVEPNPRANPAELVEPSDGDDRIGESAELTVTGEHTTGNDVEVTFRGAEQINLAQQATHTFTGVSEEAPPTDRRPSDETRVRAYGSDEPVSEASEGFPYQRFRVVITDRVQTDRVEIVWTGESTGRNELQLYAWNHADRVWELLDAAGGVTGGSITLAGEADTDTMIRGRTMDVLVQDGPAVGPAFSDDDAEPNLAFKDPAEFDFSMGFIADTQFLAQGHHNVFAEMNRWLVTNQDARNIEYTFHVGDIIQKWTNDQVEPRARDEFEVASSMMQILDDADHPNGVTAGNHDNLTGKSADLYNEYFGPDRYKERHWYGEPWRPGDNANHYDVMEIGGAKFLMVYLEYWAGIDKDPDAPIDWANDVITAHPDHNVIFATHAYMRPDGSYSAPGNNRWNLVGYRYWEEIVEPNENVVMVLAGHHPGVALNVKEDVGGTEGRRVVEMLADYQGHDRHPDRDGDSFWYRDTAFFRLLQFDVDAKTLGVNTYSASLDEHNAWQYDTNGRYADEDDEFTIVGLDLNDTYDKRVVTTSLSLTQPTEELGTQTVAAGGPATTTWSGLTPGADYTWWTETRDDGTFVARSKAWQFSTTQ